MGCFPLDTKPFSLNVELFANNWNEFIVCFVIVIYLIPSKKTLLYLINNIQKHFLENFQREQAITVFD
jgi:hypothetical protein